MAARQMFVALPEDLFLAAAETARIQGKTMSALLVEALSDTVENCQWRTWVAERMPFAEAHEPCNLGKRPSRSEKALHWQATPAAKA